MTKVDSFGNKTWFQNGKIHRDGGPAIENHDGSSEWYQNGKLHREDGPAIDWLHGTLRWWINGQLHRADGPAVENEDGTIAWFLFGVKYTFNEYIDNVSDTDEEKTFLMIKYSRYLNM